MIAQLIALAFFVPNDALTIQCIYSIVSERFPGLYNLYTCEATIERSGNLQRVQYVNGKHMSEKSNAQVQNLQISCQQNIKEIPLDVYKFFPNLESFHVTLTSVEYVGKQHLYGLSKLRSLDLFNNKIKNIGSNLFEYQPNLIEGISFGLNPIEHVGYNVFSEMSKLKTLHFFSAMGSKSYNSCYDGCIANSISAAATLITEINSSCFPSIEMILEHKIETMMASYSSLQTKLDSAVSTLTSQGSRLTTLETNYNALQSNYDSFVTSTNNQFSSLSAKITSSDSKCMTQISSLNSTMINNYSDLLRRNDALSTSVRNLELDLNGKMTKFTNETNARYNVFEADLTEIKRRQSVVEGRIDNISSECCGTIPFF